MAYKVFIDRYGELMTDNDYDKVKAVYDYNIDQKKAGVGIFKNKKIYLLKNDSQFASGGDVAEKEVEIANSDSDEKYLIGGDVVVHSISKNLINRYINNAEVDPKTNRSEGYYENGDLFLGEDSVFVRCVSKMGNIFVVIKNAVKDESKISTIVDCMQKQGVNFKIQSQ